MKLKVGQTVSSVVDATAVIVIRAPETEASLTCGGVEMVVGRSTGVTAVIDPDHLGDTKLGKRYVDDETGLEILCTKPGQGVLAYRGKLLPEKDAKPLPSSD